MTMQPVPRGTGQDIHKMKEYLKSLSPEQQDNIRKITALAKSSGIVNPVSIAGMLSVLSKESKFIPRTEKGYSGTDVKRIRQIFGATFRNFADDFIIRLKADDEKFFNFIYGGRFGNAPNEGFLYRGRGLNQITFKNNYIRASNVCNRDLVADPDLMLDINVASAVTIDFFIKEFNNSPSKVLERYGAKDINDFSSLEVASQAFYNANAGFSKDTRGSSNDGYKAALDCVDDLYSLIHF
jgi:predicted chitinase